MTKHLHLIFIWSFFLLQLTGLLKAQTITTTTVSGTPPYCAGTAVNVTYTISGTFNNTPASNVFTAELSDASGSFAGPVAIGTRTATNGGVIACTIPFNMATASLYRIRVRSSNPAVLGSDNGYNLTISAPVISTPTVSSAQICNGDAFSVVFTKSCNFATGNVFTFQLSDALGSFSSPVTITSYTSAAQGTFTMTMPSVPAGSNYRIRVVSSQPVVTSPDNGSAIVVGASAGNPSVLGNGAWNAYCFNVFNNFSTNYQGYYTETPLNINSQNMWVNTNSPSTASGTAGATYAGCPFGNTNYSINYQRTNFPCGYYQIDIPGHDDNVYIIINGTMVYQHVGCCDSHTNVWTGFLGPASTVQCQFTNGGGPGYLQVNFTPVNSLSVSQPPTICSGSSTSLTVSNSSTTSLTYSWSPAASLNTPTGSLVVASPNTSTTYTVFGTDPSTGCSVNNTLLVTVSASPATTMAATSTLICSGVSTATLTSGGANTYTWSPAAGLNTTTGTSVIANPSVTTTYTVTGSNNCSTLNATRTISVQTPPASPSNTVFGNGTWNVFCNSNTTFNSYYGYYTENNLNFDTQNRWNATNGPSTCTNTSSGLAYSGCSFSGNQWSLDFRRTGIPCGYYQVDIPYHDDGVTMLINGISVFSHNGCCDLHTAAWTGFIGPGTQVQFLLVNTGGPGNMSANFITIPYPVLSPSVTICAGTSATLTSNFISGATYSWSPGAPLATPSNYTTVASPSSSTSFTCTITDPGTTCSAAASVMVAVNPTITTIVTPTAATVSCPSNVYTLTATGGNTYSWQPASGLSATAGYSVVASPSVSTIYTVTGSNNCFTSTATTTVNVVSLANPTVFPSNTWNAYCYGDQSFTNYYGYYTDNGSGSSGYNFSTATRFSSITPVPSTANNTNGQAYAGCTMPSTNWGIIFKRTGFSCGTYSINLLHDDYFYMYVNGALVAQHTNGINDAHNGIWVGVLNANSTVEFRLVQGTGSAILSVTVVPVTIPFGQSTWVGGTSADWFTASNWCGSGVPNNVIEVVIPAAGPQFMPVIAATGAQCRTITIGAAIPAGTYNSAIPSASLGINGSYNLDVHGDWLNGGSFSTGTGTVSLIGASSITFSCAPTRTQTIYNLTIDKIGSAGITMVGGTHAVSNLMVFTRGIITQNTTLQIMNGATTTGQSNISHVDGPVIKTGTSAFVFPIGTGGLYRPIAISAPSQATDNFIAQYFSADPNSLYSAYSRDASLDHVGRCEYWILNRALGVTSNVSVTLTWDVNNCAINNLPELRVARWDAGQAKWKDQGNGGYAGSNSTGTIITNGPVTNFSPFNFGSATTNNPLPISLKSFNCQLYTPTQVNLNWSTATEHNNDYFTVESSADGLTFKPLAKIKGAGTSQRELNYVYTDYNPESGIVYYRLKQTDLDGSYSYSPLCYVSEKQDALIKIYPNPVTSELTVEYNLVAGVPRQVRLINALGMEMRINPITSGNRLLINVTDLDPGVYFLELIVYSEKTVHKINVQR